MALTDTEAIRLALLEAIEFESPTVEWLEFALKDTLPAAGIMAAAGVRATGARCGRARGAGGGSLGVHRRTHEQVNPEPLWTITDVGAAYLAALRDRARRS